MNPATMHPEFVEILTAASRVSMAAHYALCPLLCGNVRFETVFVAANVVCGAYIDAYDLSAEKRAARQPALLAAKNLLNAARSVDAAFLNAWRWRCDGPGLHKAEAGDDVARRVA